MGKLEEGLMQTNMEFVDAFAIDEIVKDLLQELEGLLKTGQQINFTNAINREVLID